MSIRGWNSVSFSPFSWECHKRSSLECAAMYLAIFPCFKFPLWFKSVQSLSGPVTFSHLLSLPCGRHDMTLSHVSIVSCITQTHIATLFFIPAMLTMLVHSSKLYDILLWPSASVLQAKSSPVNHSCSISELSSHAWLLYYYIWLSLLSWLLDCSSLSLGALLEFVCVSLLLDLLVMATCECQALCFLGIIIRAFFGGIYPLLRVMSQ